MRRPDRTKEKRFRLMLDFPSLPDLAKFAKELKAEGFLPLEAEVWMADHLDTVGKKVEAYIVSKDRRPTGPLMLDALIAMLPKVDDGGEG